jgi:hypothetical protein
MAAVLIRAKVARVAAPKNRRVKARQGLNCMWVSKWWMPLQWNGLRRSLELLGVLKERAKYAARSQKENTS